MGIYLRNKYNHTNIRRLKNKSNLTISFPKYDFHNNLSYSNILESEYNSGKRISKKLMEDINEEFNIFYADDFKTTGMTGFLNAKIPNFIVKTIHIFTYGGKQRLERNKNEFITLNKIWSLKNQGVEDWRINFFPKPYLYLETVREYATLNSYNYFFLEKIKGTSLQKLINSGYFNGKITLEFVEKFFYDLIQSIEFLNSELDYESNLVKGEYISKGKIFHRDIKPENILILDKPEKIVTDSGTYEISFKIIDFNAAKFQEGIATYDDEKGTLGTRPYAPPENSKDFKDILGETWFTEVNSNSHRNERWDLYSLGVTMYYFITGILISQDIEEIKNKELFQNINNNSLVDSRFSEDFLNLIYKSIALNPKNSYNNVGELKNDFLRYKELKKQVNGFDIYLSNHPTLSKLKIQDNLYEYIFNVDFLNIYTDNINLHKIFKFRKVFKYIKRLKLYKSSSRQFRKEIKKEIYIFLKNDFSKFLKTYHNLKNKNLIPLNVVNKY